MGVSDKNIVTSKISLARSQTVQAGGGGIFLQPY